MEHQNHQPLRQLQSQKTQQNYALDIYFVYMYINVLWENFT